MSRRFQNQLLSLLESGMVKVTQMKRNYDFKIEGVKVFATANDVSKLSQPLASRFRKLFLPAYSKEQFIEVAVKVCPKLPRDIAELIGEEVFKVEGTVRDVISISRLLKKHDGPEDIRDLLQTLMKYGTEVG